MATPNWICKNLNYELYARYWYWALIRDTLPDEYLTERLKINIHVIRSERQASIYVNQNWKQILLSN